LLSFDDLKIVDVDDPELKKLLVRLFNAVEQLQERVQQLTEENQRIRDENNRLKGGNAKPRIAPPGASTGSFQ